MNGMHGGAVGRPRHSSSATVPWPAPVAERYRREGLWAGRTLGDALWAAADATPDAVALVDGAFRLTYRQLTQWADGTALRLRRLGLGPDDRILVQLPNCWEFVVLLLGCLRLGALPVLALPAHRRHEMRYLAGHAECRAIAVPDRIKDFDHQAMARDIAASEPFVRSVLVAGDRVAPGCVDLRALCGPAGDPAAARARLDAAAPAARSVALFLLSGGTTGLPKLIARTHDDYLLNARLSARVAGLGRDSVYLAVLPLGHNFPLACPGILGTLLSGGRVVVGRSPAPEKALAVIESERVTVTAVVPAIAQRWLDVRESGAFRHDLRSLRVLQVGGARLADHAARRVRPAFGCTLQQVYGMGEGLLNFTRLDDPDEVLHHTQGRPVSAADELLVVGEDGRPVPPGEPGVLLTRGPYTPRGYYRAEEQNARAFTADGWYRTGDIVRLRPDGNLVVEGRDKDMILRGGENISAEEVENLAYQVPGVRLCAAVGVPDGELGERVCLYVVTGDDVTVSLQDVRAVMAAAGVARYKWPEKLLRVAALPMTAVGKIDKKRLRAEQAEQGSSGILGASISHVS